LQVQEQTFWGGLPYGTTYLKSDEREQKNLGSGRQGGKDHLVKHGLSRKQHKRMKEKRGNQTGKRSTGKIKKDSRPSKR